MTRHPLMLSDTAMVLLRRCHELEDDGLMYSVRDFSSGIDNGIFRKMRLDIDRRRLIRQHLQSELIYEIWLLWTFPDIPIMRSLEWHFVFNEALTAIAESTFLLLKAHRPGRLLTKTSAETRLFLNVLHKAYQEAFAAYTNTSENGS